jgi:hypothetical protein
VVSLSSHPFAVEIADEAYVAGSHFDDQPKRTEPITEGACDSCPFSVPQPAFWLCTGEKHRNHNPLVGFEFVPLARVATHCRASASHDDASDSTGHLQTPAPDDEQEREQERSSRLALPDEGSAPPRGRPQQHGAGMDAPPRPEDLSNRF